MDRGSGGGLRSGAHLLGLATAILLAASPAAASVASELAFHRGVVAFGEDQLQEAREQFQIVLAEDPTDVAAIHYLGLIADAQGEQEEAIALLRRAISLEPDDTDLQVDLGTTLLEAGRNQEALETFEKILQREPDRARAHLFAGIALYRLREYPAALPHLQKAAELDPGLSREASYYQGLTFAYQGDFSAAAGALGLVATQSPAHPLGRSARDLREQIQPAAERKRWELAVTGGIEFDSNPTLVGSDLPVGKEEDFRALLRVSTSYRFVDSERFGLSAGYDGYVSVHEDQREVDLFTNVGWAEGSLRLDPVRFHLRYDFAHTRLALHRNYQRVHRLTPSVTVSEGRWGLSELFYQYQDIDYYFDNPIPATDRDGQQNTWGINQFFFLKGGPVRYLRVGALYDDYDPQGNEFRYGGYELSAGLGVELPWKMQLTAGYRFVHRGFRHDSLFATGGDTGTQRRDRINQVEVELARPITDHLEVSLLAWVAAHDSNVAAFDYDRVIGGSYLTYRF